MAKEPEAPYAIRISLADTDDTCGVTLRDYFAAAAVQGLLSNSHPEVVSAFSKNPEISYTAFAESAYALAQIMVEIREAYED